MTELQPTVLPETRVIISSFKHDLREHLDNLPLYIDVVPPFVASVDDTDMLVKKLASPLLCNQFEISAKEYREPDKHGVIAQLLGGSVLHHLHDGVIDVLDEMKIPHDGDVWAEGEENTWYSGTWRVPRHRTLIDRAMLVQKKLGIEGWRLVHAFTMSQSSEDFRADLETERYRNLIGVK